MWKLSSIVYCGSKVGFKLYVYSLFLVKIDNFVAKQINIELKLKNSYLIFELSSFFLPFAPPLTPFQMKV